jgi:cation transport ATPase
LWASNNTKAGKEKGQSPGTIRRNLAWAFCDNVLGIPLAALGFLNLLVAAATMTLSSVFVVWNSLRLRRFAAPGPGSLRDSP